MSQKILTVRITKRRNLKENEMIAMLRREEMCREISYIDKINIQRKYWDIQRVAMKKKYYFISLSHTITKLCCLSDIRL